MSKTPYTVIPGLIRNLSASLLLLASCTKLPSVEPPTPSDDPILLAVSGRETKGNAPIVNLASLAAVDFGVSAYYSGPGKIFDATSVKYFDNHRFGYVTDDLSAETAFSNSWQGVNAHGTTGAVTANPVYWPLDGTLSFFCYAPCQDGSADIVLEDPVTEAGIVSRLPDYLAGSPLIRVTPATSVADQVDFLAAPPILDRSRTDASGSSPLDLSQHRMTQVEFWFAYKGDLYVDPGNVNNFEQARVTGIEIQDVVGSKYLYFTENTPGNPVCSWSDSVSPADMMDAVAPLPTATYRLVSADNAELVTGVPASLEDIEDPGSAFKHINNTANGRLYLLPQVLAAGAKLRIEYAVMNIYAGSRITETVSWNLSAGSVTEWPEGKVVRYFITLDLPARGIVSVNSVIIPWEDSGNPYYEQELIY